MGLPQELEGWESILAYDIDLSGFVDDPETDTSVLSRLPPAANDNQPLRSRFSDSEDWAPAAWSVRFRTVE